MSESIPDLRSLPRRMAYEQIRRSADAILDGVSDEIAAMATFSALIHHSLGFLWTGFYRVSAPGMLQVGPYQGSLGCIEIRFGRGVCGIAAAEKKTMMIPDVAKFPGHITCDARSQSEIVVPVVNRANEVIAVLDVDADTRDAFSDDDKAGLEEIVMWFKRR